MKTKKFNPMLYKVMECLKTGYTCIETTENPNVDINKFLDQLDLVTKGVSKDACSRVSEIEPVFIDFFRFENYFLLCIYYGSQNIELRNENLEKNLFQNFNKN